VQINTGGECHLDAVMLAGALPQLPLDELELLIVENVGNLICPAAFSLGTHLNVLIASVPRRRQTLQVSEYLSRHRRAHHQQDRSAPYVEFNMDYFRAA